MLLLQAPVPSQQRLYPAYSGCVSASACRLPPPALAHRPPLFPPPYLCCPSPSPWQVQALPGMRGARKPSGRKDGGLGRRQGVGCHGRREAKDEGYQEVRESHTVADPVCERNAYDHTAAGVPADGAAKKSSSGAIALPATTATGTDSWASMDSMEPATRFGISTAHTAVEAEQMGWS